MKNLVLLFATVLLCSGAFAQKSGKLPSVKLKDLQGNTVDTSTISNDGNPIVVCFWATWCSPCKRELNTYAELYEDWQDETGVKIVAVSIDDQRSVSRVNPYINSVEWDFEMLLDTNSDLKRSLGVNNVPHTFLLDGDLNIVWQHNNYAPGDEDELYEKLIKFGK
jgi:cytochrome c biogenesis protein CcmG/thiol:disulfide interchange protein DsbE